jgi:hypothetical protein
VNDVPEDQRTFTMPPPPLDRMLTALRSVRYIDHPQHTQHPAHFFQLLQPQPEPQQQFSQFSPPTTAASLSSPSASSSAYTSASPSLPESLQSITQKLQTLQASVANVAGVYANAQVAENHQGEGESMCQAVGLSLGSSVGAASEVSAQVSAEVGLGETHTQQSVHSIPLYSATVISSPAHAEPSPTPDAQHDVLDFFEQLDDALLDEPGDHALG